MSPKPHGHWRLILGCSVSRQEGRIRQEGGPCTPGFGIYQRVSLLVPPLPLHLVPSSPSDPPALSSSLFLLGAACFLVLPQNLEGQGLLDWLPGALLLPEGSSGHTAGLHINERLGGVTVRESEDSQLKEGRSTPVGDRAVSSAQVQEKSFSADTEHQPLVMI